jgi:hypothetical protein
MLSGATKAAVSEWRRLLTTTMAFRRHHPTPLFRVADGARAVRPAMQKGCRAGKRAERTRRIHVPWCQTRRSSDFPAALVRGRR